MMSFSGLELHNAIQAIFLDNLLRISDIIKNIKVNPAEYIIKRTQEIVLAEYSNPYLSLSSIAQMLNISYGYLSKIFRYQTGSNFINYLTYIRMANAKRFLLDGSLRIYEIANAVGYSSSGYFITVFKKYYHVSPSDYREKIK